MGNKKVWRQLIALVVTLAVLMVAPLPMSPASARWIAGGFLAVAVLTSFATVLLIRSFSTLGEGFGDVAIGSGWWTDEDVKGLERQVERELKEKRQAKEASRPKSLQFLLHMLSWVRLPLEALAFYVIWSCCLLGLWGLAPADCPVNPDIACDGAFRGLGVTPELGSFVYLAVNISFANMPPDVVAASSVARMIVTIELVTGVALVTAQGARFLGIRDSKTELSAS